MSLSLIMHGFLRVARFTHFRFPFSWLFFRIFESLYQYYLCILKKQFFIRY
ncbi:unnamed protein product [Brassica rapa]|uniref:Uncharacterized protein n=2 Tax=Brassica TaxID=3705 RepID=A0A8D9CZD3_BRACM|nr:unnamed protein product [Brassica napus]CAG7867712.1 unnamed protein product [Brassica rapa]